MNKISGKSDEILVLGPISPNLGFKQIYGKRSMSDLHSTLSKFRECNFSSKSDLIYLNLSLIYLKTDFIYKTLGYQYQTRTQRL